MGAISVGKIKHCMPCGENTYHRIKKIKEQDTHNTFVINNVFDVNAKIVECNKCGAVAEYMEVEMLPFIPR